jgi:hypothetical protein
MGSHITTYTPELAIRICEGIAEWGSVNKALEAVKGAPSRNTWYRWLLLYPDRLYGEKSDLRIVVPIQIITDLNLGQDGAKVVNSENIYEVHAIEAAPAVTTEDTPDGVEDAEVADRPLTPREELASQYVVPAFGATSPVRANTGVKGKPGRPRKGHKTPAQLRVTMAAYGNRKKPLGGSGGTA